VIATPIMAVMMLLVSNEKVMGTFVARRKLKVLGWTATGAMAAAVLLMFVP
jgi:Mn2+/Fe2+ NRAMP family transporter